MEDTCICCGAIIPEGRQVCPQCEKQAEDCQQIADVYLKAIG